MKRKLNKKKLAQELQTTIYSLKKLLEKNFFNFIITEVENDKKVYYLDEIEYKKFLIEKLNKDIALKELNKNLGVKNED